MPKEEGAIFQTGGGRPFCAIAFALHSICTQSKEMLARGHVQMTSALGGRVGVAKNMTKYDEGEGGISGILTSYFEAQ